MHSYRETRNKVNSLNISLKKKFYKDRISQHSGNMKETWKITNYLLKKRSKSTNINSLNVGNIDIVDKREISNTMNSYFCSVGDELANKIEDCANPMLTGIYAINKCSTKFHFNIIQDQHIRDAMAKIKTSKGFGNDNISGYFLNLALPIISKSLTCLFNMSISQCKFPASWKIARVTPIFKDGDKSAKENYRPISVLPVISRLFEKVIYNQLYSYLNSNGFLSTNQSGFRALHSTLTTLLKNTDDWYSGMDLGKYVGTVFVDLKKAFDTVDHNILLQKLNHYGVQELDLKWFESYLSNRKQFIRIDGVDSSIQNINTGVPQGSCLGPLLFLVYINDLPYSVKNAKVSIYADDTSLALQSENISQLTAALNDDLRNLHLWLKGNKLSLNVAKTQSLLISTKHRQAVMKDQAVILALDICNEPVVAAENIKYLGVYIDKSLDWEKHIQEVSKKVSRSLGVIKYCKRFLPFDTLKCLYKSILDPHFRYCCPVWGVAGASEINHLQKLQNRAARIITSSSYDAPSKMLIKQLGWRTIEEIIQYESRVMVYKSVNGLAPQYLQDIFTRNSENPSYELRSTATDLHIPKRNTASGQKGFSFRGSKLWNSLSAEIKSAPTLISFKNLSQN